MYKEDYVRTIMETVIDTVKETVTEGEGADQITKEVEVQVEREVPHLFVYYDPDGKLLMWFHQDVDQDRRVEIQDGEITDKVFPVGKMGRHEPDEYGQFHDHRVQVYEYRVDLKNGTPKLRKFSSYEDYLSGEKDPQELKHHVLSALSVRFQVIVSRSDNIAYEINKKAMLASYNLQVSPARKRDYDCYPLICRLHATAQEWVNSITEEDLADEVNLKRIHGHLLELLDESFLTIPANASVTEAAVEAAVADLKARLAS